ncbi:protein brambleberry-like [Mya arenaria]|uniref:protein brambleberry-like n=1 Tax=Mya arenaria TaxID=6604 RepID=UPI0022E63539|nr:protein brambleberry-like [Mya arenaria]
MMKNCMIRNQFFFIFTVFVLFSSSQALFDWIFGAKSERSSDGNVVMRSSGLKFEVQTADDKFLQLKDVIENLSELDSCNHIVVYKLKKRCGDLSEEDLGKLAVQLLNCQSSVEQRPIYPCTDEMELAECTKDMDSTTWNSYQIVNNRARALCYATQQQQFRRLAEVTVNELMSSAHGQLQFLKELQDGQDHLQQMTSQTVRELYESQKDLLGTQQTLRSAQDGVLEQIHGNMLELKHEKAMIAAGNKELADLSENIREKLDKATEHLQKQEATQFESHEKIVADLTHIQQKSHDALNKLDQSSEHLLQNHEEMVGHYERMYTNMVRINSTVVNLLATVNMMQRHLDERINWFSTLLHMADDKLSILTCGALHISYFLFAALAASFLQAPPATRVALFTLVSLNATMEIQCGHSLDFASITLFLFFVCGVNYVYIWWKRKHRQNSASDPPYFLSGSLPAPGQTGSQDAEETNQSPDTTTAGSPHDIPLSPVEIKQLTTNLGRLYHSLNESVASETSPGPRGDRSSKTADHSSHLDRPSTSAFTPYRRPEQARPDSSTVTMQRDDIAKVKRYLENLDENTSVSEFDMSETRNNSGARFRHSTPHRPASRGSSSTNRSYCQGITKTGTPCRSGCTNGSEFCHRHRGQGSAT